jgi:hypothetical protein
VDDQLLIQEQVLGDNSSATAGANQLGQGGEQVKKQVTNISYVVPG